MAIKKAEETLRTREGIMSGHNKYLFLSEEEQTFKKEYRYMEEQRRLLAFANEQYGSISDTYILFAVAKLGVTDRKTIQEFLKVLFMHDREKFILDPDDDDAYGKRISALCRFGFLFKISYFHNIQDKIGTPHALYTITSDGVNFVKARLSCHLMANQWIQSKTFQELLAWAAASYVGVKLSQSKHFRSFEEGIFRNRNTGAHYYPCECKFVLEENEEYFPVYAVTMNCYLQRDTRIMSEDDFASHKAFKVNAIRNYIRYRSKKGPCYVFCVVMDNDDLMDMGELLVEAEVPEEELDHIYFTGVGAFDESRKVKVPYLKMKLEETEDTISFDFYTDMPFFL